MEFIIPLIIIIIIFLRFLKAVKSVSGDIFSEDTEKEEISQNNSSSNKIKIQTVSTKDKFEETEIPKIEISYVKTTSPSKESLEPKPKKIQLTEEKLEEAIIYSIILGPPKSAIIFPKILGRDKQF